jgi:chromosomal replication initiator protein
VGEAQRLWDACADVLRQQVSAAVWMSTFADTVAIDLTNHQLVLVVPASYVKERIETRYLELVRGALADVGAPPLSLVVEVQPSPADSFGPDVLELPFGDPPAPPMAAQPAPPGLLRSRQPFPGDRLDLRDPARDPRSWPTSSPTTYQSPVQPPGPLGRPDHGPGPWPPMNLSQAQPGFPPPETGGSNLNPKYTFDNFVIGASNRFAHATALAVSERPGMSYNPLFVYGNAGLGKTHLLQSVGHYVRENYPSYRVRYVSSETFLNEFVESIRTGEQDSFKRRYRTVDLLLVDDIQFFEGKRETLEEFFHTFNTLFESGRQIVLSCDRKPDEIPTLEDRLRSRFKSGLVVDVQPPDLETRLAILRKKAYESGSDIPDDVLTYIATNITDNVRELDGALIRVAAFANLSGEPLTSETAQQVLGDLLSDRPHRAITPEIILNKTSEIFGLSVEELLSPSRTRVLVNARQIAMYACRELTELSFPQIAKAFGKSDHTTVIHATRKIEKQMSSHRQTYDQVTNLINQVRNGE